MNLHHVHAYTHTHIHTHTHTHTDRQTDRLYCACLKQGVIVQRLEAISYPVTPLVGSFVTLSEIYTVNTYIFIFICTIFLLTFILPGIFPFRLNIYFPRRQHENIKVSNFTFKK